MIYNTNIDDIKKEMDILKDKLILTKNTTDYEFCFSNLCLLNELYNGITNTNYFDLRISKNYIHKYINAYNFFIKNNNKFLENFIKNKEFISITSETISNIIDENLEYNNIYDNRIIKENDALEIIYEYLNKYHNDEIKYFNHLKDNKRIFYINEIKDDYEAESTLGECILSYENDPLIAVRDNKFNILNISTLIHEFGHAVEARKMLENYSKNQVQKYEKSSFYTEVNSLKYQKEFLDFCIDNNIYKTQTIIALELYYSTVLIHSDNTFSFTAIKDGLLQDYKYLLYEDKIINQNLTVPYEEGDDIIEYSNMDLIDSVRYFIGGLIATHFSILIKEDKEEAKKLYRLFNSIKLDEFSPEVLSMLNINSNNLEENLNKDINKMKIRH